MYQVNYFALLAYSFTLLKSKFITNYNNLNHVDLYTPYGQAYAR